MNRIFASWLLAAVAFAGLLIAPIAGAAPEKAICLVCKVLHGEAEEEPVKAVRTHAGKEYFFCSEKCANQFALEPASFLPPEFPREAPAFTIADMSGKPIANKDLHGKVVLLDFWATWCAPCRKSMPEMQALHDKFQARGFSVIGVSIDEGGPAKVKKYVAAKRFTYPMAMDSGKSPAWEAFGVKAVPAAFLLDRDGRIVAQWTGTPPRADEVERKLEELLRVD